MISHLFYIFALPNLPECRVNLVRFTNFYQRIGVVSLISFCSAIGGFGDLKGATLFFNKQIIFFQMPSPEKKLQQSNKVCSVVTFGSRNELELLSKLQEILITNNARWYNLQITKKGYVIKFSNKRKNYYVGYGSNLKETIENLCSKIQFFNSLNKELNRV